MHGLQAGFHYHVDVKVVGSREGENPTLVVEDVPIKLFAIGL